LTSELQTTATDPSMRIVLDDETEEERRGGI
jgi:hypothetical protein